MTDDIVGRLRKQIKNEFVVEHPHTVRVPTLHEQAADEIERLRTIIDNMAERNQKQNAEQLRIVRAVEADRNRWRDLANRLGAHLGEGLYNEGEWECREYAIAAYSAWQNIDGARNGI